MSLQGQASSTIRSYISGISFKCKVLNIFDPTQNFVVKKMFTGLSRLDKRHDLRMPVTLSILNKIIPSLPSVCSSNYESILFSAVFTIAFFGFFRVGELVQNTRSDVGHALQTSNVKILTSINALEIRIPISKTDQLGRGATIVLPATNQVVCPVQAVKAYLQLRPNFLGSFFRHLSGSPLTRYQFVAVLKSVLQAVGVDSTLYSSHSFRIGAATSASLAGISDEKIAQLGRWKSDSFKTYIRIPKFY